MRLLQLMALQGMLLMSVAYADPFSEEASTTTQVYQSSEVDALPSTSVPTAPAPTPAAPTMVNHDDGAALLAQPAAETPFAQLSQNVTNFEQQAQHSLQSLAENNQVMTGAIQSVNDTINRLQQRVNKDESMIAATQVRHLMPTWWGLTEDQIDGAGLGAVGMFLLLLGFWVGNRRAVRSQRPVAKTVAAPLSAKKPETDVESEYDFMGTNEAIPAKLDLARSYMAMNDMVQAKSVLKTIVQIGNAKQRAQASALLEKIVTV